jgi:hypothetical protein
MTASTTIITLHCRRQFPSIIWSPLSPSTPIKDTPTAPHLTAPHTALLSSSLTLELTPTARRLRCHFATIARPLHRRPVFSEGTPGTTVVHHGLRLDVVHDPWTESSAFSSQK